MATRPYCKAIPVERGSVFSSRAWRRQAALFRDYVERQADCAAPASHQGNGDDQGCTARSGPQRYDYRCHNISSAHGYVVVDWQPLKHKEIIVTIVSTSYEPF